MFTSARTVSEEWSSSGDSKNDDEEKERRSPRDKEGKDKDKDSDSNYLPFHLLQNLLENWENSVSVGNSPLTC